MKPSPEAMTERHSLVRRNLILVASYLAVMLLIAGAYA